MPRFRIGDSVETEEPTVLVENDLEVFLPPGAHTMQLIVVDDSGNRSEPTTFRFIIRDSQRPTAVITGPREVETATTFEMSGAQSSDVPPGRIVGFQWTLLD